MAINDTVERIVFEGVDKITTPSKTAQRSVTELQSALSSVQGGLAAIGVTVGAGAFVAMTLDTIRATAALDDMAESTGASVESLSAIRNVAKVGGQDFEGLTGQIGKMIKGLKEGSEEGGKTASALKFLGVEAKDANGNFRDTGQILIEVAKSLDKYADDGNKVALIQDALGKGAERYAPLLKDIAQGTDLVAKVTKEQAAAAEEAEKNINRLKLSMEDARRELVVELTPAIVKFTNELIAATKQTGGLATGLALMFKADTTSNVEDRLAAINEEIAKMDKQARSLMEASKGSTMFGLGQSSTAFLEESIARRTGVLMAERRLLIDLRDKRMAELGRELGGLSEDASGNVGPAPALRSGYVSPASGKGGVEGKDKALKEYLDNLKLLAAIEDREAKDLAAGYEKFEKIEQQKADILAKGATLRQKLQDEAEQRADDELERNRVRAQASLDAFKERMLSEEEREIQRYQKQRDLLDLLVLDQAEYDQITEAMHAEHVERMGMIEEEGLKKRLGLSKVHKQLDLDAAKTFFGSMSLLMQTKSREMFEIGKVAAISQTIITTYEMAVKSYNSLSSIPIVGPALGAAAAAAAVAYGMAQVSAIKSQSFGGGGGGGAVPTFSASPSTGLPTGSPGGDVGPRQSITIKVVGDPGDKISVGQLRELMEQFADASEGGARIFVG